MKMRDWVQVVAGLIVVIFAAGVFFAWRAALREQGLLQAELQATKKELTEVNSRQQSRDAHLTQLLGQWNKQKVVVQKPEQIVKALPDVLALPRPLAFESPQPMPADKSSGNGKTEGLSPKVHIPPEDLKPLYDFAVDCKECQAKLSATQADLQDERTKTKALSKERDDALRVARGGSVLRRVGRAAKWCNRRGGWSGRGKVGALNEEHRQECPCHTRRARLKTTGKTHRPGRTPGWRTPRQPGSYPL